MCDAFVVPGRVAEEALDAFGVAQGRPLLTLPNVDDEALYRDRVQELRADQRTLRRKWGLDEDGLVLLWPARLHEQTKGILNFLKAVAHLLTPRVSVLLAGDGPDRGAIEAWLAAASVSGVRLTGWCGPDEMVELYAVADALLLPSLADPNPLSVVEGLWAGLPLLISDRCGNWPEAVEPGQNGWVVDPGDQSSIQQAFGELVGSSHDALTRRGTASSRVAQASFETPAVIARFVDELLALGLG